MTLQELEKQLRSLSVAEKAQAIKVATEGANSQVSRPAKPSLRGSNPLVALKALKIRAFSFRCACEHFSPLPASSRSHN